jgi:chromosomal replication initiation ATPase DnaA
MRPLDPQYVLDALCQHYGITRDDLAGNERRPVVVWCRWLAAYLMHEYCRLSYPQITRLVTPGRRGHTSMILGAQKIRAGIAMAPRAQLVCRHGRHYSACAELHEILGLLGRREAA